MHLDSVDLLHPIELSVEYLLLVVSVLELPEYGHIYQIELLLCAIVAICMIIVCGEALL